LCIVHKVGSVYTIFFFNLLKNSIIGTGGIMITKTNYVSYCKCPKWLYLSIHKKDEEEINEESIRKGNETGALARGLFGNYALVGKDTLNMEKKVEETKEYITNNSDVICEASFIFKDLFCAVDILKKVDGGYEIYEVKSTTSENDKTAMLHYYQDIAFQSYVLTKLGYKVVGCNLVLLNEEYVRIGDINIQDLFKIINIDEEKQFIKEKERVRDNLAKLRNVMNSTKEVMCSTTSLCLNGQCPFSKYCTKDIREDSVLNLYSCRKKFSLNDSGIDTFEKLLDQRQYKLSEIQRRQIDFYLNNREDTYLEKDNLSRFLEDIKYPIYFLDFETINEAIPPFDNSSVYQQIPVQFSLHILREDGTLEHKEYVGDGINDPREDVARLLLEYIKDDGGSIVSYNASFEKGRISELSTLEGYSEIVELNERFVDLLDVFRSGYIYNKDMRNSFSIKSTLPALFKDDKELNYKSLDEVHNGTEAMKAYNSLKLLSDDDRERLKVNLLKYCELDTYAMVKLYQKMIDLTKLGDEVDE